MGSKNVRLSFEAWKALRNMKFNHGKASYTEVFNMIFDALETGKADISDVIVSKKPSDIGSKDVSKSDKTVVLDESIHRRLADYKIRYMMETNSTARGPGAVSISQIVMTLIEQFKKME